MFDINGFALGSREVKAEETKSETIYKYIQATQDIPYLPNNYQYTNWRERATQFNEMLFNMNDYDLMFYEPISKKKYRSGSCWHFL